MALEETPLSHGTLRESLTQSASATRSLINGEWYATAEPGQGEALTREVATVINDLLVRARCAVVEP